MKQVRRIENVFGHDDDWLEDDRRVLFEKLDGFGGHAWVREKGDRDYITTAEAAPGVIEKALTEAGYQRNLASTRKFRTYHGGGKQWAVGSYVYDPAGTEWQHHVFLFEAPDGTTDVYGHREVSVREGKEHVLESNQEPGDPNYRARAALEEAGIAFGERVVGAE